MPEGPEIRRAADKLAAAVIGRPLTEVDFAFPQLKHYRQHLIGERILAIEPRGKALLTHFSNGLTMYSHNQLYGVWKVVKAGERPDTKRDLRVRLETADSAILLYSASDITLGPREEIEQHPFLKRIGPDVLDMSLTAEAVAQRLLSPRFCKRQLGGMLLDQAFLAGLGNYLRAEILWQAALAPQHKPQDLAPAALQRLAEALLAVPRLSYQTRGQVNENRHHGVLFSFKVFHRSGEPCERCGAMIARGELSSRPFYWCPGCQK
ncbi:DNA glycosylase/AP lyase Nei [Serratia entomophila]|uniref:endonuclease VIII n=1 Tax=Serratia entomophila TaxID=42906 RepID=UPI00217C41E4|nr:endonuclease VIII [Serratia entomophila]CAI1637934.1 DNA glycosylase/AP lyase Nei [Serratia entomophila]CAI1678978.1 DNA glycosylase/AP lyase Nei [Serratia entomophila]CAI1849874.1 DNA glycosylase/AP lyase Nei [Serratia entomophila]CAI2927704.1 DNA glycosylase/AP lyase Nei [Serratia entomophila]